MSNKQDENLFLNKNNFGPYVPFRLNLDSASDLRLSNVYGMSHK